MIGMVLGSILLLVQPAEEINAADWLGSCIGYIFAAWICVSIMLPIRLKFDSEKSRYANLIMIAVVFIAAFLVSSAIDYLPVSIVEAGKEWFYSRWHYSCCGHHLLFVQPAYHGEERILK